jgi:hypothetical protein
MSRFSGRFGLDLILLSKLLLLCSYVFFGKIALAKKEMIARTSLKTVARGMATKAKLPSANTIIKFVPQQVLLLD